jgi:hypothetical protein
MFNLAPEAKFGAGRIEMDAAPSRQKWIAPETSSGQVETNTAKLIMLMLQNLQHLLTLKLQIFIDTIYCKVLWARLYGNNSILQ